MRAWRGRSSPRPSAVPASRLNRDARAIFSYRPLVVGSASPPPIRSDVRNARSRALRWGLRQAIANNRVAGHPSPFRGSNVFHRAHDQSSAGRARCMSYRLPRRISRATNFLASSTIQRIGRSDNWLSAAFRRAHFTAGDEASTCTTRAPAAARANVVPPV